MIEAANPGRIAAVRWADLPRTAMALLVSGALAPALFILLNLLWAVVIAWEPMRLSSADALNEAIGLCAVVMLLGWPASIGAAPIAGLPGIYLARLLRLTSARVFCLGGAVVALGCTAWFARDDVRGWVDLLPFAANMAVTGACCGFVCWRIAEAPDRSCPATRSASAKGRRASDRKRPVGLHFTHRDAGGSGSTVQKRSQLIRSPKSGRPEPGEQS